MGRRSRDCAPPVVRADVRRRGIGIDRTIDWGAGMFGARHRIGTTEPTPGSEVDELITVLFKAQADDLPLSLAQTHGTSGDTVVADGPDTPSDVATPFRAIRRQRMQRSKLRSRVSAKERTSRPPLFMPQPSG